MVLHKLADAFGLKITPLKLADARPVLEDNIAGLTARDTVALFECGPHPAVSPANCDSSPTTAEVPEVRRAVVMPPTSRPARGALGRGDWRHLPVAGEHVTAISREPTFVTFINPEPITGVTIFARIADEVSCRHPEVPFLVVKSRRMEDVLVATALAGGFDLRRHSNIMLAEPVPDPRRIYGVTRLLLIPSLEEAAGRIAAEALLNGIPVIASDRGGLAETLRGGGFVLPLPSGMTPMTKVPPPPDSVQTWVDLIIRLMTDEAFYTQAAQRAYQAGRTYDQAKLVSLYCSFFADLLRTSRS
jgi:glycosyltransferase involved in cell wall biosynthesis